MLFDSNGAVETTGAAPNDSLKGFSSCPKVLRSSEGVPGNEEERTPPVV